MQTYTYVYVHSWNTELMSELVSFLLHTFETFYEFQVWSHNYFKVI